MVTRQATNGSRKNEVKILNPSIDIIIVVVVRSEEHLNQVIHEPTFRSLLLTRAPSVKSRRVIDLVDFVGAEGGRAPHSSSVIGPLTSADNELRRRTSTWLIECIP